MNYQVKPKILRLNASGEPIGWISWQHAAYLYVRTLVLWTPGQVILTLRGGHNRATASQSLLPIHSIIACKGRITVSFPDWPISLTNRALFNRDEHRCLYCGHRFSAAQLTRDHIKPQSKGGKDTWVNCATACRRCNYRKGGRTPEEARMRLLVLPYRPNYAEYLTLCNSGRILGDQWQFLQTRFSAKHRISSPEHVSEWESRQPIDWP